MLLNKQNKIISKTSSGKGEEKVLNQTNSITWSNSNHFLSANHPALLVFSDFFLHEWFAYFIRDIVKLAIYCHAAKMGPIILLSKEEKIFT
jgi:exo-beta-1,3-glucanase (GH17 family)